MALLGVDGCRGAWVAARLDGGQVTWRSGRFAALLDDELEVVAVDMPIGLAESGPRSPDVSARAALGAGRARLFSMPVRDAFDAASHADANVLLRSRGEPGMSAQAWGLRAAIAEVAVHAGDPRVIEVHPELSFTAMAGHVLESKKSARGAAQRIAALTGWVDVLAALAAAPPRVPVDDCLDALGAAWSAQRFAAGTATAYPGDHRVRDRTGRAMVIYA